jgi:predicted SprT family Zn-dependent metalloprotease
MSETKLLPCVCGKKPKLSKRKIGFTVRYFVYSCKNCDNSTFGTRSIDTSEELWNSMMKRKNGILRW